MRYIRIIPKLDIKNGLLIKGINLEGLRVLGDAFNFAEYYYNNGADEICYIDNVATLYGTNNLSRFVKRAAKNLFVPLTVGGGIRSIKDIERMLKSGADKVCLNSAIIKDQKFLKNAVKNFGSSTIVAMIESNKINNKYFISTSSGRDLVKMSPIDWAKKVEDFGAGEILLTSVNKEGLKSGYDIHITKKVSEKVKIPVIAHGGAGSIEDIIEVIKKTKISGVSLSGMLHYDIYNLFFNKKNKLFETGNTFFINNNISKKKPINYLKKLKDNLFRENIHVRR